MKALELFPAPVAPPMTGTAIISPDGLYRYELRRAWAAPGETVRWLCFVMLNPSTADAFKPDQTISKCIAIAKALGFTGIVVVNLFAIRSTDCGRIRELRSRAGDPIGVENDAHIRGVVADAAEVICAWGRESGKPCGDISERARAVLGLVRELGRAPLCLGTNDDGSPKHPLFLSAKTTPVTYARVA